MSGPIVRSGASPEFSENWDRIFGGKKKGSAAKPVKPAKSAKKKSAAPKKAVKKAAKKQSK